MMDESSGEVCCVCFDAVGTLFRPREPVGATYARCGARHGLQASAERLEEGFRGAFRELAPPSPGGDREWWMRIVAESFAAAGVQADGHPAFGACFDELYAYYATAGAWTVFPEVPGVLARLRRAGVPLWVVSNFDERLPVVLERLGLSRFFDGVVLSSQVGVAKPAMAIFEEVLARAGCLPGACLHVGDDPVADWQGARAAGLAAFELRRPAVSLEALPGLVGIR